MNQTGPHIGQLYQVKTRGEFRVDGSIEKCLYIVQGSSQEDVRRLVNHAIDPGKYRVFTIISVTKVVQVCCIKQSIYPARAEMEQPDSAVRREDIAGAPKAPELNLFTLGISGRLRADNELDAMRRVGSYLLNRGLEERANNPFLSGSVIHVEAEGLQS